MKAHVPPFFPAWFNFVSTHLRSPVFESAVGLSHLAPLTYSKPGPVHPEAMTQRFLTHKSSHNEAWLSDSHPCRARWRFFFYSDCAHKLGTLDHKFQENPNCIPTDHHEPYNKCKRLEKYLVGSFFLSLCCLWFVYTACTNQDKSLTNEILQQKNLPWETREGELFESPAAAVWNCPPSWLKSYFHFIRGDGEQPVTLPGHFNQI